MAWWDVGSGAVIGEGPADVVTTALQTVVAERAEAGRPEPSLAEVLAGVAAALPGEGRPVLVASTAGGEIETDGSEAEDSEVACALREAFGEVERQYEERWQRAPSRRELLETLLFVLLGAKEELLVDGDGALESIEERP